MKKLLATALAATALLGSVFALGEKKTKQTVITVLDYQDATAPNSFDDNKLIWDAFEAAHPDIKIEREALFNEAFHQKAAAYAAAGKMRGPYASGHHTHGHPLRRASGRRSTPYDPYRIPDPARRSPDSRDSGRAVWVYLA